MEKLRLMLEKNIKKSKRYKIYLLIINLAIPICGLIFLSSEFFFTKIGLFGACGLVYVKLLYYENERIKEMSELLEILNQEK